MTFARVATASRLRGSSLANIGIAATTEVF